MLEKSYFCSIANNSALGLNNKFGVVICLKNRTFAVSQTTLIALFNKTFSCDLLEKSYFCSIANNCQLCCLLITLLWFAWKIVLLQYRKQRTAQLCLSRYVVICLKNRTFAVSQTTLCLRLAPDEGCDLLEKSYFCSIANNRANSTQVGAIVVICLKNRTFAVSQTTCYNSLALVLRCDLLEKSYFCSIANNRVKRRSRFQRLWFAWKIVLLQYRKQRTNAHDCTHYGCDLLEKSYFCSIANNTALPKLRRLFVVICLKNRTFAVSQTTKATLVRSKLQLWFAWKIVLLQYRKQLVMFCIPRFRCCDLLEKSYFCSIANNS